MAADVWKTIDVYGRIHYYENETAFNKAFKKRLVEQHFVLESHRRNGIVANWLHQVKGWRIVNDLWLEQPENKEEVLRAIGRRQARELRITRW